MARLTLQTGVTAAALAAVDAIADAAQADADQALIDAATAQSDADAAIAAAGVNLANLLAGPGLPVKIAPVVLTGITATDIITAIPIPTGLTLAVSGERKYALRGTATCRDVGAVLRVEYFDVILNYNADAGPPATWTVVGSNRALMADDDASFSTFFAAPADAPTIGDNSGVLSFYALIEDAEEVTFEFDGVMVDYGVSSV